MSLQHIAWRLGLTCILLGPFAATAPGQETQEKKPPEGINDAFQDPDVEQFVKRFESESREVYSRRKEIVAALGLKPGMNVADIGAGTGLFTRLFAEAVGPDGKVYAEDISKPFLEHIASTAREAGQEHVKTVQGTQDSAELPANSADVAFICDVYHHFEHPEKMLASIHRAIRPEGHLFVIEFDRREGVSPEFVLKHVRAPRETFLKEIEAAGFRRVKNPEAPKLKDNFFAEFVRVERPEPSAKGEGRP